MEELTKKYKKVQRENTILRIYVIISLSITIYNMISR